MYYYVSTWMTKSTQRKYQRFILIIIFTVIWIGCAWLVHVHKVISDHKRSLNLEMAWVLRRRSSKRANWARENRGALGFFMLHKSSQKYLWSVPTHFYYCTSTILSHLYIISPSCASWSWHMARFSEKNERGFFSVQQH